MVFVAVVVAYRVVASVWLTLATTAVVPVCLNGVLCSSIIALVRMGVRER